MDNDESLSKFYPSVEETARRNAAHAARERELDAPLIAIDNARAAAAAAVEPAPTAEQTAADDATLNQYLALKKTSPFAAIHYQACHSGAIYRAMARQPEDSTGPMRAISPRHPARRI